MGCASSQQLRFDEADKDEQVSILGDGRVCGGLRNTGGWFATCGEQITQGSGEHRWAFKVLKVDGVLQALVLPGDLQPKDIGVISPYSGQVSDIKERLKGKVEVASADAFQGKEKEVIIVSTTRANESGELGFVQNVED